MSSGGTRGYLEPTGPSFWFRLGTRERLNAGSGQCEAGTLWYHSSPFPERCGFSACALAKLTVGSSRGRVAPGMRVRVDSEKGTEY
jgi:hypothetical protein